MSNKVLRHPEMDEIIEKLTSGVSTREVERWLKKKHPKSKRLQISYMTLQKFRADYLNIEGEVLDDIKASRNSMIKQSESEEKTWLVQSSNAYQEKLSEIINQELDVTQKMLEMEKLISARMEFYFNILHSGGNLKEEKMFLDLLSAQRELLRDWKKYVEGVADTKIEHNVNINIMNEQISVLKNVVYEVLREMDPAMIPVFVEKINSRFEGMEYNSNQYKDHQLKVIDAF